MSSPFNKTDGKQTSQYFRDFLGSVFANLAADSSSDLAKVSNLLDLPATLNINNDAQIWQTLDNLVVRVLPNCEILQVAFSLDPFS